MKRLNTYWHYWWTSAALSVQASLENRIAAFFFLAGKFIRFFLFLAFLTILHRQVKVVGGFTLDQMVTFFLVFNLFDLFGQIFFRGIYWFREQVVSGEFDFRLTKPLSSLFQALTRQTDILDLPLLTTVIYLLITRNLTAGPYQLLTFLGLLSSGMVIITAIHIIVAALGVVTTEVDHTIMIFRDVSAMARFPVDIYTDAIRAILTFIIPIGIAYTFPAKALLGLLQPGSIILSGIIALVFFSFSLRLWRNALTQYSSASS